MTRDKKRDIIISPETHNALLMLKAKLDVKTFDGVIKKLLNQTKNLMKEV